MVRAHNHDQRRWFSSTRAVRRPDPRWARNMTFQISRSLCSLSMDQVDQVTDIFHAQNLPKLEFGAKSSFYRTDQLDMAQRIPLFDIRGGHLPANGEVVFLEDVLEDRL